MAQFQDNPRSNDRARASEAPKIAASLQQLNNPVIGPARSKPEAAPFPREMELSATEAKFFYYEIHKDGSVSTVDTRSRMEVNEVKLKEGTAQFLTALPYGETYERYLGSGKPVLLLLPGWWGTHDQNCAFADAMAAHYGLMVRVLNPEGDGTNFKEVLELLKGEQKVVLAHSAGYSSFADAYRLLSKDAASSIQYILALDPIPDTGGMPALINYWRGLGALLLKGKFGQFSEGFYRFAAGNVLGLEYAIDSKVTLRNTLFGPDTSSEFLDKYRFLLGRAKLSNYVKRCFVDSFLSAAGLAEPHHFNLPKDRVHVLHAGRSAAYKDPKVHVDMAMRINATYEEIPGVYHQALALPDNRRAVEKVVARLTGLQQPARAANS